MTAPLQRSKSLTEQAADEIRARILRGDFELGAPLSENMLAAQLGVSKTPIREALLKLQSEGLVSVKPQRGSFVFNMTAAEVLSLGELRELMETNALALAMERDGAGLSRALDAALGDMRAALDHEDYAGYRAADAIFHQAFFDRCGNPYLAACYQSFAFRVQALRARLSSDGALNEKSYGEHCQLVELIAASQAAPAREALLAHIGDTTTRYVAVDVAPAKGADGARERAS